MCRGSAPRSSTISARNRTLEKLVSEIKQKLSHVQEQLELFRGLPAERDRLKAKVEKLTQENVKLRDKLRAYEDKNEK